LTKKVHQIFKALVSHSRKKKEIQKIATPLENVLLSLSLKTLKPFHITLIHKGCLDGGWGGGGGKKRREKFSLYLSFPISSATLKLSATVQIRFWKNLLKLLKKIYKH